MRASRRLLREQTKVFLAHSKVYFRIIDVNSVEGESARWKRRGGEVGLIVHSSIVWLKYLDDICLKYNGKQMYVSYFE